MCICKVSQTNYFTSFCNETPSLHHCILNVTENNLSTEWERERTELYGRKLHHSLPQETTIRRNVTSCRGRRFPPHPLVMINNLLLVLARDSVTYVEGQCTEDSYLVARDSFPSLASTDPANGETLSIPFDYWATWRCRFQCRGGVTVEREGGASMKRALL